VVGGGEFHEEDSFYNFYTRPQNLYMKARNKMSKERMDKSMDLIREV
jgi:hypothetical protein